MGTLVPSSSSSVLQLQQQDGGLIDTDISLGPRPRQDSDQPAARLHCTILHSLARVFACPPFLARARHDFLIEDVAFRYVLQRERRRHHCHCLRRPLPLSKVSHDVLLFLLPSLPSPDPFGSLDHATPLQYSSPLCSCSLIQSSQRSHWKW